MRNLIPILLAVVFFSCKKSNDYRVSLEGTRWHVYQYQVPTSTTAFTRNDTIIFSNASNYKYNGVGYNYYLSTGENSHLTMNGTPFGDIDGRVGGDVAKQGEIIGVPFSQIHTSSGLTYTLWMKKF